MRRCALRLLAVCAVAPWTGQASASGLEVQGLVGRAQPTYSQSFSWNPALASVESIQGGSFDLTATGALALGVGITFFASDGVGIEARVDAAELDLGTANGSFSAGIQEAEVIEVSTGVSPADVDFQRLTPLSLNLRLRVPGALALNLSGGLSYLPELRVEIVQPLPVATYSSPLQMFDVREIPIRAGIESGTSESRIGGNLGIGVQIRLSEAVSLAVEARGFRFAERTLAWSAAPGRPLTSAEQLFTDAALRQIDPVTLDLTFVNATAGLAISF